MPTTPSEQLCAALVSLPHQCDQAAQTDLVATLLTAGASLDVKVEHGSHIDTALGHWARTGALHLWPTLAPYATPLLNRAPHRGRCPLAIAAQMNRVPMMETLVEAGACVDGVSLDAFNPLLTATTAGNLAALERLIGWGARLDAQGYTVSNHAPLPVLHTAVYWNHQTLWRPLINAGCDPNGVDAQGRTVVDLLRARENEPFEAQRAVQQWEAFVLEVTARHAMPTAHPTTAARARL